MGSIAMSNPPRKKGTGFETEVMRQLGWPGLRRTPPGTNWDIELPGEDYFEVLATRPDRGRTLVTLPLTDFAVLFDLYNNMVPGAQAGLKIECKRYARLQVHTLYESKFSRTVERRKSVQPDS